MVAGCDRVVRNGIGANEADLSIVVCILLVDWGLSGADAGLVDGSREVLGGGVRQILAGITIVLAAGVSAPLVSASAAVASSSLSSSPLVLRATLGSRRWS
jgi:urease alpha subunit